jgi:hypothetical protein
MHDDDGADWPIVYIDFLTACLGIFIMVAGVLLPLVAPMVKSASEGDTRSPGTVRVEASWAKDMDVDLWVLAPTDRPVGYSNRAGRVFNLLRDDLGYAHEAMSGVHFENAYSRNAPAGEYVVNLHMYNHKDRPLPVEVEVAVTVGRPPSPGESSDKSGQVQKVHKRKVLLHSMGQEVTVIRFRLDARGEIVPGSINSAFQPVRGLER